MIKKQGKTQKQAFCKTCCKLKKRSVYVKIGLTLQSLTTLKIGELLLTAIAPNLNGLKIGELLLAIKFPNLSDVTIWRVTITG